MARTTATKQPVKKSAKSASVDVKPKPRGIHAKLKRVERESITPVLPPDFSKRALGGDVAKLPPTGTNTIHTPTPESRLRICKYVAFGMPLTSIMELERLDDTTIMRHYAHELKVGAEYITYLIANSLMQQALAGNTSAAQYYLSRRAKWTETINHKHEFTNSVTEGAKDRLLGNTIEEDLTSTRKR